MSTARLSNLGYLLQSKETVPGTAVAPTIAVPLYEESLNTLGNFQDLDPAAGSKFATYATVPGIRSHKGDVTVLFEANSGAHFANAFLTQGSPSNASGVYTYPYVLSADSASYTWDVSIGNIVKRFFGVKVSKFTPTLSKNEWRLKLSISALGSFDAREISTITGSGPYTVTLKDPNGVFDGSPTKGLIVGDLIRFNHAGTTIDAAVSTVVDGLSFTTSTNPTSVTAGDSVQLRPVTPTYNNLQSFLWSKTRFYFGTTATAAFSASHTPVEEGSTFEITHKFHDDGGEGRSGSFDPNSLERLTGDIDLTIKKLCDTPEDVVAFKNMNKSACVVRLYAGSTNQYECRITYNALIMDNPLGNIKAGELVYVTEKYHTNNNQTDGQAFDVKFLCALTTV